jgi:predicted porin
MKKSLLAVAAIGAFASAAQAQSSVTVYGLLDVGYVGSNTRLSTNNAASYPAGTQRTTANGFTGKGAENTSRLGFKGTEDLGGGSSAFFTAEFELYPQDQDLSGGSSATASPNGILNRQTFVGLKKNGLGQAAMGLQYTPIFNLAAATDPGQLNNVLGNVVYQASGYAKDNANNGYNAGFTNRTANTLSFKTDTFSGLSVSGIYTLANANATVQTATSGGNTNASGWGLAADYTWNKLYIGAAMQQLKQLTYTSNLNAVSTTNNVAWSGAAPAAGVNTTGGVGLATQNGLNVQDNQYLVGATYDFGILKAYAQYVSRTASATQSSNFYTKRSSEQIGVRSFITPTIESWASAGLGRYTAMGVNSPTANFNAWQLGTNYYLSKRTNLYAIYGQQIQSTAAYGTTSVSSSANNYALGLRHTF